MMKYMRFSYLKRIFMVLFASLLVSVSPNQISAIGFTPAPSLSDREKAHRNITFTGGGEEKEENPCTGESTSLTGNNNPEKGFNYFVQKGFTEKQAAGIIGNFMVESGMNPKRVQGSGVIESKTLPSSGGYGLAQWDDRKTLLGAYTKSKKTNPQDRALYDLGHQLDFVMFELKGPTNVNDPNFPDLSGSTEAPAFEDFKKTTTIQEATTVWREKYERPGKDASAERLAAANKAYGDFATGAGSPAPDAISETETATCGGSGDIVSIAQAELKKKVMEDPIGCDAGNPSVSGDCGKEVNKYTDSTLEYWCADFVSWVYKTAGTPFKGGSSGGWRIPSVEGVRDYMKANGTYIANSSGSPDPKPGDVYVINDGVHIGIVVKVQDGDLYAISGNTSTENYSNGVGVGDTIYKDYKSNSSITGYGGLR